MASSWRTSSPPRLPDHYRPHAPVNLSRSPRLIPRQPDCWRPGQRTSHPPVKTKEEQPKEKKDTGSSDRSMQSKKKRSRNKRGRRELKARKANPLGPSNSNRVPLEERQMGVINSIIKSDEQSVGVVTTNSNPKDQPDVSTTIEVTSKETSRVASQGTCSSRTTNTSMTDPVELEQPTSIPLRPRPKLPLRCLSSTSDEPEWSRTKITEIPSAPNEHIQSTVVPTVTPHEPIPSTADSSNKDIPSTDSPIPDVRQKLDFGDRVDQCLLKMDKWANAWLSNAFTTADPNPNPDYAWQSFEHCLSIPDVLEDGEIIEYEEVSRCKLPATETQLVGPVKQTESEQSSEALTDEASMKVQDSRGASGEEATDAAPTLPPIRPGKRPRNNSILTSSNDEANRTDFRETSTPDFQSSSPEFTYKRIKASHIPSAAAFREEARRKRLLLSSD